MPVDDPPFAVFAAEHGGDPKDVGLGWCDVQGWTTGQYADWLEDTLATTLLAIR